MVLKIDEIFQYIIVKTDEVENWSCENVPWIEVDKKWKVVMM